MNSVSDSKSKIGSKIDVPGGMNFDPLKYVKETSST